MAKYIVKHMRIIQEVGWKYFKLQKFWSMTLDTAMSNKFFLSTDYIRHPFGRDAIEEIKDGVWRFWVFFNLQF